MEHNLIKQIASDEVIDQAFAWLCQHRLHYHYNADVWQLRRWWTEKKPQIQALLLSGQYRFRELRLIRGEERVVEWWCSADALVLKAMAIVLTAHLQPHLSRRCFHLAGTGGMKAAVREVAAHLSAHEFVFRTDVKGYYASINHDILLNQVRVYVDDCYVLDLVQQYLQRFVSDGGEYTDILQGISLGCPLSPLMGALYLKPLDDRMAELGCFYVRFMDDWVVLAPTRWKLRRAIKAVNEVMNDLLVAQHPDKTFIGRTARGFDFLGDFFTSLGLGIAEKTIARMLDKVSRLYEQGADDIRIEMYVQRWWQWVKGGVDLLGCDRTVRAEVNRKSDRISERVDVKTQGDRITIGEIDHTQTDRISVRDVKTQGDRTVRNDVKSLGDRSLRDKVLRTTDRISVRDVKTQGVRTVRNDVKSQGDPS